MSKNGLLPLKSIHPLKWDLGLPHDFARIIVPKHPDLFRFQVDSNGSTCLELVKRVEDFAVSELQKGSISSNDGFPDGGSDGVLKKVKRGQNVLKFPMSFPKGYGGQKKVKAWMDEFHSLPYISPYEDSSAIDRNSDLMEKRIVGLLHEFLSLTVYKKTKRNYLRSLREELNLPHRFTRIFTRYPGIFYLSLKCKTTTVTLKEGYRRGKLVNPCPLARYREKFSYVMRTGLIYRNKGLELLMPQLDELVDREMKAREEEESEEEEFEVSDERYEDGSSELKSDSDED